MVQAPPEPIYIATEAALQSSHRHVVSLRSWAQPENTSSVLLYRSPDVPGEARRRRTYYAIVNECPHLGLPLEQGDIEDLLEFSCGDDEGEGVDVSGPTIICPFHQYDFNVHDGSSATGMTACTHRVEVRTDGTVWMDPPGEAGEDWRVLGIRAVSERFADSSALNDSGNALLSPLADLSLSSTSPSVEPRTIVAFCRRILLAPSPDAKVALTRRLVSLFRSGSLTRLADPANDPPHPHEPYRAPSTVTVASGKVHSIGKGGTLQSRIKLLHSLATIEQWAIDLAVDHIARFWDWRLGDREGKKGKKMGWEFVSDFLKVAEDEAKYFTLLSTRLSELGTPYGSLSVHSGLWDSALETSHSLFSRLAIIALVHEARGLDTNIQWVKRLEKAGDEKTARVIEIIHYDEITHVSAGHRHFTRLCSSLIPAVDPVATFRSEVNQFFYGAIRGPFNEEDREKAGLGREWYEDLGGRGVVNGVVQKNLERAGGGKGSCAAGVQGQEQSKRMVKSVEVEVEGAQSRKVWEGKKRRKEGAGLLPS
ncbi:hypothetical protein JCM11251_001310 [Rhodosporidiobolus azoricus]